MSNMMIFNDQEAAAANKWLLPNLLRDETHVLLKPLILMPAITWLFFWMLLLTGKYIDSVYIQMGGKGLLIFYVIMRSQHIFCYLWSGRRSQFHGLCIHLRSVESVYLLVYYFPFAQCSHHYANQRVQVACHVTAI